MVKNPFIKSKPKVTFYETCKEIPLYNFQKYLETSDLRYFTKEFVEHKDLHDIMTRLFGEWLELTKNNAVINRFAKMHKMMKLDVKYRTVTTILKAIYNHRLGQKELDELIAQLKLWGYTLNRNKDLFEQLDTINNRLQNLRTQYEMLEIELAKEDKKESQSIEKQLIIVSKGLELNYPLKAKEITLFEWWEYQQLLKQRQIELKKQRKK